MKKAYKTVYQNCVFAADHSTVIQGCSGNTAVNSTLTTTSLDALDREALRLLRSFSMRQKIEALSLLYTIEDTAKEVSVCHQLD